MPGSAGNCRFSQPEICSGFALLKPQRYQSPPAWRWSNPSIASQDPIDAALVPPLKRSRGVRHTLTALPALPQLSLLFRREPCPCMPLHSHTSSSAKIGRCCVDSLNSPPERGHRELGSICPLCATRDLTHRSKAPVCIEPRGHARRGTARAQSRLQSALYVLKSERRERPKWGLASLMRPAGAAPGVPFVSNHCAEARMHAPAVNVA